MLNLVQSLEQITSAVGGGWALAGARPLAFLGILSRHTKKCRGERRDPQEVALLPMKLLQGSGGSVASVVGVAGVVGVAVYGLRTAS